jgi:hypothetical protein
MPPDVKLDAGDFCVSCAGQGCDDCADRTRTFKASIHRDGKGNWFFNRHAYDVGPYDSAQELCEELGKLLDQSEGTPQ